MAQMRKMARMSINYSFEGARVPTFSVGDRLKKARESAGIKQQDLAADLELARRSLIRFESSETVKRSIILAYAMRTGVPVEWLESGECTPRDLNPEPTGYGTPRPLRLLSLAGAA